MNGPQVLGTQHLVAAGRRLVNCPGSIARFTLGCQGILHHLDSEILHLSPTMPQHCYPAVWVTSTHGLPLSSRQALAHTLTAGVAAAFQVCSAAQGWEWKTCICARTAHLPVVIVRGSFIKIDFSLATIQKCFSILTIDTAAVICSG